MSEKIRTLSIDIETYSSVNLNECGTYKYAESPDAELLLFGYSVNGGPVRVVDVSQGELIPDEILSALSDETIIKWIFNASFERVFLSVWLKRNYPQYFKSYSIDEDTVSSYLDPASWRCSRVWCAYMGLPLSLEGAGSVLELGEQKMSEGRDLIKYFCQPCIPTKTNGDRTRNLPTDDPEKWRLFKSYNKRDVEVEMAIQQKLQKFLVPDFIWDEYEIDQKINDRGILVDLDLVRNAIRFDALSKDALIADIKEKTGVENPNSVMQMKYWLAGKGINADSLGKKEVKELISAAPPDVADVLRLRQQLSKSSVKKYQKMEQVACADGRARGMYQFYGANRTGRWSGRLIQLQNLPRNTLPDLVEARSVVKSGDYELMSTLYEDIPDTLSQLIRTAFVPRPGYKFIVADFSSIEARVLSFLAQEQWRIDAFANGEDIYSASASKMFGVPVGKHGPNANLRQRGKVAELALGYAGSVGALKKMGALEMGLSEGELRPLVNAWRSSNPRIVQLWQDVDLAVLDAVKRRGKTEAHGIRFAREDKFLFITLPSGRRLAYANPRIEENCYGSECVTYEGISPAKKWMRIESYGPKFVENITQGISRDILAYAMKTLRHCFIVGHVHDELIIECSRDVSVEKICRQMSKTPPWIQDLQIRADGYECDFYRKD